MEGQNHEAAGPSFVKSSSKKAKKSVKKLGLVTLMAPTSETFVETEQLVTPEELKNSIDFLMTYSRIRLLKLCR